MLYFVLFVLPLVFIVLLAILLISICFTILVKKDALREKNKRINYSMFYIAYICLVNQIYLIVDLFAFARNTQSISLSLAQSRIMGSWFDMEIDTRIAHILGGYFWINMNWIVLSLLSILLLVLAWNVFRNVKTSKLNNYIALFISFIALFNQINLLISTFLFAHATNIFPRRLLSVGILPNLLALLLIIILIIISVRNIVDFKKSK